MKKLNLIWTGILLIIGIVGISLVSAHGSNGFSINYQMMGSNAYHAEMHEKMDGVFDSGSYKDFQVLRKEYGMPMMYWMDSPKGFEQMKEIHEQMEEQAIEDNFIGMPCQAWG